MVFNYKIHLGSKSIFIFLIFGFIFSGCTPLPESLQIPGSKPSIETNQLTTTATPPTPLSIENHTRTAVTSASTIATTPEAKICQQPTGDYEIIEINGHRLNNRTYQMLKYAASIYQGQIDITGDAITQGSYTSAEEASFGTHMGGGAVDLSVMKPGTYTIQQDEIAPLIHALRVSGFAAWYRDFDELYIGSPVHIHAIAIGDKQLSLAAREQIAGPFGYIWGYNGLPTENGVPVRDPHGGPIICPWMVEMGYPNKTATPSADED